MPRRLIVNADDFGFTQDVNRGILACHLDGILTATTIMATGRAFRHAVELARSTPSLDVGCHLVLVGAPGLPNGPASLIAELAQRRVNPRAQFASQIAATLKAGIRPTHLDTHKHTHLLPPVLDAVLRVSEEFGIPFIRKPVDFALDPGAPPSKRAAVRLFRAALRPFDRKLARAGGRRTDHFTGFQLTGRMTEQALVETLRSLPEGSTELMCHPAFLTEELSAAATRLKRSRDVERLALCAPQIRRTLEEAGVQLIRYREL